MQLLQSILFKVKTKKSNWGVVQSFVVKINGKGCILGSPNPKKWLSFGFVGIFEYIILPMLIIFLGMCPNSYGWMPSL